jgi:nicotinamide phosphoribosyltransferase
MGMIKLISTINNFILKTDSYKLTHFLQYPKGTTKVYSYLESRGGKFPKTMFFGLQYFLTQLDGEVVTEKDVHDAQEYCKMHFGQDLFNFDGWMYIAQNLQGRLPIRIKAVKEGTVVATHNVLMTIENTDDKCYWLTNALETMLMRIWYPITVATNGFYAKKEIAEFLEETGCDLDGLNFKLHDFGYRGVQSEESAGIGGMAHLVNFWGTDTTAANSFANEYYNLDMIYKMYGFSVPASEHSVECSWGRKDEDGYFLNMLDKYPTGIVSIVSDGYDVFNFVKTMSTKYKDKILARNGVVVFRPDSGDPVEVNMKLFDILWNTFGGTYTKNGYRLLDKHVRLIQGDGIVFDMQDSTISKILTMAKANNIAADNWVFGSGGGLLQKWDRDTQKFAIKASYGVRKIEGSHGYVIQELDLVKTPVTSKGKTSKSGMLKLHPHTYGFTTISSADNTKIQFNSYVDALELVFENGEIKREQSFDEIRGIAENYLKIEMKKETAYVDKEI